MNRNEMFKKFLSNPKLHEVSEVSPDKLIKLKLTDPEPDHLVGVIKTAIMHLDDSVDVSRRINQYLKSELNGD